MYKNEIIYVFDVVKAVHMTREAALDSRLMSLVSTKGAITARSLDTSVLSFIPSEFVEKLVSA